MNNFVITFCDDGNSGFRQILVAIEVNNKELTLYVRKCETFISQALFNYIGAKLHSFQTPFINEEPAGCPNIPNRHATRHLRELTHIHFIFTDKDANMPILTKIIMYAMIEYQQDGSRPLLQEIFYEERSLITKIDDEVRGIDPHNATPILTESNYKKIIEAIDKASQITTPSKTSITHSGTQLFKIKEKSYSSMQELFKTECDPIVKIIRETIDEKCPPPLPYNSETLPQNSNLFPDVSYTFMMVGIAGILFVIMTFFQKLSELTERGRRRHNPEDTSPSCTYVMFKQQNKNDKKTDSGNHMRHRR